MSDKEKEKEKEKKVCVEYEWQEKRGLGGVGGQFAELGRSEDVVGSLG